MPFELSHMLSASPEMFLLGMACVILIVDLFLKQDQRLVTYVLTQISLVGALALTVWFAVPQSEILFDGNYVRDPMSDLLKVAIYITALFAFVYAKDYLIHRDLFHGEYFILGLMAVLGMMVIVSAGTFLTVYLGLELLALSMYTLVAFDRDSSKGSEAAMKYFVLGALASGLLLYGISMIYGATGSISLREVSQAVASGQMNDMVLVFGLVFVVIGVAFKFGAVPFHMWVPDVYDGAPTAVTLFVGSIPKIAAFALAMRILVDGLGGLHADWQGMLIILSVLSVAIGNVVAIAQTNIKRMFAYSTISHVGFILMGILAGSQQGYAAAMFYSIVYALMALGGFGMLILLSRKGFDAENLEDLRGLNERSPWYAGMMLLLMFSMAGVPPLVGFFAKLFVLDAVVRAGFVWLAVVGVLFSLVGAFYYLRIIKLMYFDKPAKDAQPLAASMDAQVAMSVNGLAMLLLGLYPAGLLALCLAAVK